MDGLDNQSEDMDGLDDQSEDRFNSLSADMNELIGQ